MHGPHRTLATGSKYMEKSHQTRWDKKIFLIDILFLIAWELLPLLFLWASDWSAPIGWKITAALTGASAERPWPGPLSDSPVLGDLPSPWVDWGDKQCPSPPGLSQKLCIGARRAGRHSEALVETHLIHAQHFTLKVTCHVKVRPKVKNTVFTVWTLGSVRLAATSSSSSTCLAKVLHEYGSHTSKAQG